MAALAIAGAAGVPSAAKAQSQTDFAEMAAALKRLEGRVAALEGENKQAKQEAAAARAEAHALRQKLGAAASPHAAAAAAPAVPATAPGVYAMVSKAPPLAPAPSWSGFYAGAAFGMGRMRAPETQNKIDQFSKIVPEKNLPIFDVTNETTNTASSLSGQNVGAISNLYLGYNFLVTPTVALGAQVEGGIANIRVNLNGAGSLISNSLAFLSGPPSLVASPNGTTTTVNSAFNTTDSLDSRWMVSILGRGGVLVDPLDYVYLLGGYTYARFETFNSSIGFGLNGATVGSGWERQIVPGWSLRGEYRYTKFQGKDVSQNSVNNATTTLASPIEVEGTFTTAENVTQTNHVTADMHSLWIGVAHYFDR